MAKRYAYTGEYTRGLESTVCAIYTEGELAARSSIRQVGKVTNVPLPVCDKIAKLVPATVGMTLKKALDEVSELREIRDSDPQVKRLLDDALLVEGTPVQTGIHAAGIIVADKPISEYAPLFWNEDTQGWVIQFDMVSCEADCGLLKFDFLGLRNLDIIMRCENFIRKTKGVVVDARAVEQADDPAVIADIYAKGDTDGIFQFESGGMKKTLKSFMPTQIEDVILLNAAYRPGPMQYIPKVTDVKFGKANPNYIVPEMQKILEPTYGSPIYQEQIQQIFHEIAGFSLGQADIIRRAMSKKHLDELEAAKDGFVAGFRAKGAKDEEIEQFWNELLEFAKYAFNKSHAAAYSVLSYYTAWLKHYYPVEYMAALMSFSSKDDMGMYAKDARDYGIKILPPDVNKSIVYTAPTKNGEIRFGLEGIMGVGAAASKIVAERKNNGLYDSLDDFILRCTAMGVGKGVIESLTKVGALSGLTDNRQQTLENIPAYISACRSAINSAYKADERLHASVLESAGQENDNGFAAYQVCEAVRTKGFALPEGTKQAELDFTTMLRLEKECAGCYLTGNPLEKHKALLEQYAHTPISDISSDSDEIALVGQINELTVLRRKSDNAPMCKFVLEDFTGSLECICFVRQYAKLSSQMAEGSVVYLKGRPEAQDSGNESDKPVYQFIIKSARKLT